MSAATSSRSCATWSKSAITLVKQRKRKDIEAKAELAAEERMLDALVGVSASAGDARRVPPQAARRRARRQGESRSSCRRAAAACRCSSCPTCPAPRSARSTSATFSARVSASAPRRSAMTVVDAHEPLVPRKRRRCSTRTRWCARRSAKSRATASSSSTRSTRSARATDAAAPTSRARACSATCLPLIEGTTVATKHGAVKTDHILFIASGAFHVARPSDLLPELQGRLPIRVELASLTEDDFKRILTEHRGEPDQAIRGADGGRGRELDLHRRRDRGDRPHRRARSTPASRTSARGGCRR